MKRTVFMLVNDINIKKGGINGVIFTRTHLFNNDKYSSHIVTLDDNTSYPEIEQELKADGHLAQDAQIINIYDYYRNKFTQDGRINEKIRKHYEINMLHEEEGYHYQFEGNMARYFKNGQYIKYKRWNDSGELVVVDYFSTMRVRNSREEYHPEGYLIKRMTYHPTTNKVTQIHHYTKEGFCYLSVWFHYQTGKIQRIILFSPNKQNAKVFLNNIEFHSYFLQELCSLEKQTPIIICDESKASVKLQHIHQDQAIRIYTLHTNHLQAPYKLGSELKKDSAKVLTNEDHDAPIVVRTNQQKIDIETQFSHRKWNISVISYAIEPQHEAVEKQTNLIISVNRLHAEKRLDLLIEAFRKVVDEVPDAMLHLYGTGPEKAKLQQLVKKLKLNKSVQFKGYTADLNNKLAEALFLVNTSLYEGQGLVMVEAMAQRTPTLTFKINYIVREILSQVAGKTVEDGQLDTLAEAMIDWLYSPQEVNELGNKAWDIIRKNYSLEKNYKQWDALFEAEISRRLIGK